MLHRLTRGLLFFGQESSAHNMLASAKLRVIKKIARSTDPAKESPLDAGMVQRKPLGVSLKASKWASCGLACHAPMSQADIPSIADKEKMDKKEKLDKRTSLVLAPPLGEPLSDRQWPAILTLCHPRSTSRSEAHQG